MIKNFFEINKVEYIENASLKKYNTYRVNTICKYLVFPKNRLELVKILQMILKEKVKFYILGNGSNVIFSMEYYDGIIIKLDKLNNLIHKDNLITVEAGYPLIKLALTAIDKSLSGLEFAAGIPGQVGASTAMNAGAYNSDMSMIVKEVEVLCLDEDCKIKKLSNKELKYSYRNSILKNNPNLIVISTTFKLKPGDKEEMKLQAETRRQKRLESQPLNYPSAGSVFRNPENMYAGQLIEECNLKGYSIHGAEVSTKHANFIINKGEATGKDIIKLINKVKEEVMSKDNVELKLEQIIIK